MLASHCPEQWGHWSPQVGGRWGSVHWWCDLTFVQHHSHSCRSWTIPSAAYLPQIYQHQSIACLVGSRLVGIDPHPVHCLMAWAWICAVSWWWMPTTQPTMHVSNASLSLVEGQRTLVTEHGGWEGGVSVGGIFHDVVEQMIVLAPNTRVAASRLKAGGAISASTGSWSTRVGRKLFVPYSGQLCCAWVAKSWTCCSYTSMRTKDKSR